MPKKQYILSIDQGTTGTRAILVDEKLEIVASSYREHKQIYPIAGWVEHDPEEIFDNCCNVSKDVINIAKGLNIPLSRIKGVGLSNQGETIVVWNKKTGRPVYNAIVWQCRRTASFIETLKDTSGILQTIQFKTGLIPDAYFSASKIKWVIDNVSGVKASIRNGNILAGTVDSWIIWKLTGGKSFFTDPSTASRTMLYNIHSLEWDKELLSIFGITDSILPSVIPTGGYFGTTDPSVFCGLSIPISGSVVDQQGALFGQGCISEGMMKCTYGTGCFLLMNVGEKPLLTNNRIMTSIGWQINGKTAYVLEAGVYSAGAVLQWLKDKLSFISDYNEANTFAETIPDTDELFFVPAFTGLAAPIWDSYARGMIVGITARTTKAHIVRAALESIAYQVKVLFDAMVGCHGTKPNKLKVDGGISQSNFLMQFQADILNVPILRPLNVEASALGAALFAGLTLGVFDDIYKMKDNSEASISFYPIMDKKKRDYLMYKWHKAVKRSLNWVEKI